MAAWLRHRGSGRKLAGHGPAEPTTADPGGRVATLVPLPPPMAVPAWAEAGATPVNVVTSLFKGPSRLAEFFEGLGPPLEPDPPLSHPIDTELLYTIAELAVA